MNAKRKELVNKELKDVKTQSEVIDVFPLLVMGQIAQMAIALLDQAV